MAEGKESSNTAMLTILIIALIAIGVLLYINFMNTTENPNAPTVVEKKVIETPSKPAPESQGRQENKGH